MPKASKARRQGSKRERKLTGFQTPPSVMPAELSPAPQLQDSPTCSVMRKTSLLRKSQGPPVRGATASLSALSPSLPSALSQEHASFGVAESPSTPPRPPPALPSSSAFVNAAGPSPPAPPSMVFSSSQGPPTILTSSPPPPQSPQLAVYATPSSSATLPPPPHAPSPTQAQPAKQQQADRPLLLGASYRAAVMRRTSLHELAALRSLRSRTFSGQWANRGQMLLSPLLSRLRSSSSSSTPHQSLQPTQLQANGAAGTCNVGSDEYTRLHEQQQPSKLRWHDERRDHQASVPSFDTGRRSPSRTSASQPADPVPIQPRYPASKTAGCSRCNEASQLVGSHGPFQTTVFYFVLLVAFVLPFHTLPLRIANHDVDHWCARPAHLRNMSTELWKEVMIPRTEDGRYSRCRMNAEWNSTGIATVPCVKWEFAQSTYGASIVQDYDLVCERAWFLPLSCCAFATGAICTLIVFGPIADRFGRKPVIQFSTVVLQAAGIVILFSTIMNSFIAMRLLQGAATSTLFNTSFVLLIEVLSPEHRTLYSIAAMMGKVFGAVIAAVMMWAKFSWYTLQLTSMLPCLLMFSIFTALLESPRWLLARGNVEEAEAVIMQAAMLNGESMFEVRQQLARTRRDIERGHSGGAAEDGRCDSQRARSRKRNSVILCYLWTVTAVASEAASLKIHYLDLYPAALLALSSLLSFPTELVAIVSAARLGRRASQSWALGLAAFACFVAATLGDDSAVPSAALLLVASVSVDASQVVGTLYTAEMYPTVVRCTGLSLCKCFSAAASVATPLAVYLGLLPVSSVPLGLVSLMCVTAAYLAMRLPDTQECTVLPDQLADAPFDLTPQ
ncbi:hypothetical protein HPB49_017817 [Dermacentor silvarum]|uniref:Uncharacterized protein n=1 Tax=Dermacentor silvarum TaxID=543639 RepID=A0ACB8CAN6_DERSI|nr:hypothetical protein HPB49_017817 [Dermacentor silvarum]